MWHLQDIAHLPQSFEHLRVAALAAKLRTAFTEATSTSGACDLFGISDELSVLQFDGNHAYRSTVQQDKYTSSFCHVLAKAVREKASLGITADAVYGQLHKTLSADEAWRNIHKSLYSRLMTHPSNAISIESRIRQLAVARPNRKT